MVSSQFSVGGQTVTLSKLGTAALVYAERFGWSVFPLKPKEKRPLSKHGLKDATTDPHIIKLWWKNWPTANIGVPTGFASGFDALDVDEGGAETLAELEERHGKLPDTVEQLTGGGGRHPLFQHRDGVRNSVKRLTGLDVRGEGGYIVVPPSVHPSGREYAWELSSRPGEVEIAEWPSWLLDALRAAPRDDKRTAAPVGETISEGRRNNDLTSLAGSMRDRGMDEEEIAAALLAINKRRCVPPSPESEVRGIAASVSRYEPGSSLLTGKKTDQQTANTNGRQGQGSGQPDRPVCQPTPPTGGMVVATRSSYIRQDLAALRANYNPPEWIVDGILPNPGMLLIGGIPGAGKTWLVLDTALAVATGRPWLGRFQTRQGAALLVLEEEDPSAVVDRLDLLRGGLGLSQEEGDALPIHLLVQQGVSLVTPDGTLEPELLRHVEEVQPALIVLDPFRRVHQLEENDSGEMSLLFTLLRQLTQFTKEPCSLLLAHHFGKRNDSDEPLNRLRGSSDIAASVDGVLEIGGEFGNLVVKHTKSKRGPSLGTFLIQADTTEQAIRLKFLDPDVKAEIDRESVRKFILQSLDEGPKNQSQLREKGEKRGYGRNRLSKACEVLAKEGLIEARTGPKNSKVFALVEQFVDIPAPLSANSSEVEQGALVNIPAEMFTGAG